MSFLDRLRGLRQEATQRQFGTTVKKNAPPTYINEFILGQHWVRTEPESQAKMVQMNPWAWAVTVGLAHSVFEDRFRFVDPEDPEKEIMQDVLKDLKRMEIFKWCTIAVAGERAHGHTWLFMGDEELTTDVTTTRPRLANLDVFTPLYATVTKWDDLGRPFELTIKVLTSKGHEAQAFQEKQIFVSDCILVRTRPFDRSHEGLPVTSPIWNSLVSTALLDHAITTYSMKWGLGGLIMKTKGAISTEDKAAVESMMEDFSVSTVGVVPGKAVESLEYIGASGSAVDFPSYQSIFKEEIAAGTKIPLALLIGLAEATAPDVGPGQMAQLIQGEQRRFEPVIREIVFRGWPNSPDFDIDWPVKTAIDRRQEAEIRMLEAQAESMETASEMAKEGKSANDSTITVKSDEKAKDQDKNNNPAGVQ